MNEWILPYREDTSSSPSMYRNQYLSFWNFSLNGFVPIAFEINMVVAWQYQLSECTVLLVLAGCCLLGPVSVLRLSCYYSCLLIPPLPTPQNPRYLYHSCSRHFTKLQLVWVGSRRLRRDLSVSVRMLQTMSVSLQMSHRAVKHCLYGKNGRLCHVSMRDRRQLFSSHLIKRCMLVCWCCACSLGHLTVALL